MGFLDWLFKKQPQEGGSDQKPQQPSEEGETGTPPQGQ